MPPVQADIKNKRRRAKKKLKGLTSRMYLFIRNIRIWLKIKANRGTFANILMICFIIFTSIGAGMIFLPAGWVVAGVCCGIFGFLLGSE